MARKSIYPPSVTPGKPKLGLRPKGWKESTFKDVLKVVERPAVLEDNKEYQLVLAKRNRGGIVERERLVGKKILTKTQFIIKENDFLIAKRQIVHGACGVVPPELNNAIVSNEYSVLRVNDGLSLDYLNYYCHSTYFQQTCFQSSVGVDVEKMIFRLPEWLRYKHYFPPSKEQRKIAQILSTWDKAIDQTSRLIEAKQKFKRLLMKDIFDNLIPNQSSLNKMHIGNLTEVKTGGTPSRSNSEYWNGDIPWMSSGEINKRRIFETNESITKKGFKNSNTTLLPDKTVMIALNGQGKTRGTVAVLEIPLCCNQSLAAILPNDDFDSYYLYHFLDYRYYDIRNITGDGSRTGLNLNLIKKIQVDLPDLKYQKKISKLLNTIDEEIYLLNQKNACIKHQKKGLMQKLLTGQVRVNV